MSIYWEGAFIDIIYILKDGAFYLQSYVLHQVMFPPMKCLYWAITYEFNTPCFEGGTTPLTKN